MVLKRKRSDDDDAMSICSSSSFSRDSSISPFSNGTMMMMDTDAITQHHIPLGVHSRTLKRWRNSRPDEKSVYEYTMSKLFSAQKQTVQPTQTPTSPSFTPINHPPPQQRSLLSFFSRGQQQHTHNFSANPLSPNKPVNKIICSDCDCTLETPFDDEEGDCYTCRGCYKKVCGGCSTGGEEWGTERRCLECTMH